MNSHNAEAHAGDLWVCAAQQAGGDRSHQGSPWARLGKPERQSLADHLHVAGPEDHCLVAFYLLQQGRIDEARLHLALGGDGGAEVWAAFKP